MSIAKVAALTWIWIRLICGGALSSLLLIFAVYSFFGLQNPVNGQKIENGKLLSLVLVCAAFFIGHIALFGKVRIRGIPSLLRQDRWADAERRKRLGIKNSLFSTQPSDAEGIADRAARVRSDLEQAEKERLVRQYSNSETHLRTLTDLSDLSFKNEAIQDKDRARIDWSKFKIENGNSQLSERWTIDRQRDTFLIHLGQAAQDALDSWEVFSLNWKGWQIRFEARVEKSGVGIATQTLHWRIKPIRLPNRLRSEEETVYAMLAEAIAVYGTDYDCSSVDAAKVEFGYQIRSSERPT